MANAKVILDRDFAVGAVDPRLFGGFAEHLGRHIYTGIYEPEHPTADSQGFREDVISLVRELDMPLMRYPGGNFVSGYNWEDGVGPKEDRPAKLDLAWRVTEPNTFGTNEFVDWCRKVHTQPALAVNLGTRGPDEARAYLEYCNHPGGSQWSDLRRQHGYADPHDVKVWCLGNEMDGPWQIGHKTPAEYARLAQETARIMKFVDPDIELIACGSSNRQMPTFGSWELEVLDKTFDHVDYVSLHTYYGRSRRGTGAYLAWPDQMDQYIEESIAFADAVAGKKRSSKRLGLAFDEWNIWGDAKHEPERPWMVAPRSHEAVYTVEDALCFGGMILSLLNHADRVKIGCLAQVVNVIAPIMTEPGGPAWRQTIFYPFAQASAWGRGEVLQAQVEGSLYDVPNAEAVPHGKLAAIRDPETDSLTLLALNRAVDESLQLSVDLRGFPELRLAECTTFGGTDPSATNTRDAAPVRPEPLGDVSCQDQRVEGKLPPLSWNMIRCVAGTS